MVSPVASLASEVSDADGDCDLDVDDLNIVINNFGVGGSNVPGDVDFDGVVDISDRKWVENNFNSGTLVIGPAPASGSAVQLWPAVSRVVVLEEELPEASWLPGAAGGALIQPGQGDVVAIVDFFLTVDDVGRPEALGWGNVLFDIPIVGEFGPAFGARWLPNSALVDHDGLPFTPERRELSWGTDLGPHREDLLDVFSGHNPNSFGPDGVDPRRTQGQDEPVFLGSIWLEVDTHIVGGASNVEAIVKAFSTYDEHLDLGRNDGEMSGGLIAISVPEAACTNGDTRLCDGQVNLDDLNHVRNHLGSGDGSDRSGIPGDTFPFDGLVDIDDLNNIRNRFGEMQAAVPVPEPTAGAILLAALAGWRPRARRKRICKRRHR